MMFLAKSEKEDLEVPPESCLADPSRIAGSHGEEGDRPLHLGAQMEYCFQSRVI